MYRLVELTLESEGQRLKERGVPNLVIHTVKRLGEIAVEMTLDKVLREKGDNQLSRPLRINAEDDKDEGDVKKEIKAKFELEVNGNEFGVTRLIIILEALPEDPEAASLQILQLANSLINEPYLSEELSMIVGHVIDEEFDSTSEVITTLPV